MASTVSVVIITYNYGRFIAGALDSVLGQTRPPDEIIVVDDGSTDDTAARVAAYADRGVRYLYQQNAGMSAARNRGIRAGQSELIAFLDSDDRWLPDKLALQLEHLAAYPAAGLVTGSEWQVYEGGQPPLYVRRPPVGAVHMYPEILIENSIGNSSLVLVRRACFDQVGLFDEGVGLGQDWDMWMRIARVFPIGVVNAPLIYFTRHGGSVTAGKIWQRYQSNRGFHHRYIDPIRPLGRRLNLLRRAQSMNYYYTAADLLDAGQQGPAAVGTALAAALLDPVYEPKNKAGVLFRAVFGRALFDRLRGRRLHRRPARPPVPERLA